MNANDIKTIADLKEYPIGVIENLSWDYEHSDLVNISSNTYRMGYPYLATYNGYIDLENPVYNED